MTPATGRRQPAVRLSELGICDVGELTRMFWRCSQQTLHGRFGSYSAGAAEDYLRSIHDEDQVTIAAWASNGKIVGVVTVFLDERPEIAAVVEDRWQYRGVGRLLVQRACNIAARHGASTLYAQLRVTNVAARRVLRSSCAFVCFSRPTAGEVIAEVPLHAGAAAC